MHRKGDKIHIELTGRLIFVQDGVKTKLVLAASDGDHSDIFDIVTAAGWNPLDIEGKKVTLSIQE